MMIWVWTGMIVLFGIVEALTAGLVCIWFAAGSLAALAAAFLDVSIPMQVVVFVAATAAALAATRPLMRKFGRREAIIPTNLDRAIGGQGKVTETIDNENSTGAVYVDGKTWTARSARGEVIPAGTQVRIVGMEGVKLFVEQFTEKAEVV